MSISETSKLYRQRSKLWFNNDKWNYQAFYSIYRSRGVRKLVIPFGITRSERVKVELYTLPQFAVLEFSVEWVVFVIPRSETENKSISNFDIWFNSYVKIMNFLVSFLQCTFNEECFFYWLTLCCLKIIKEILFTLTRSAFGPRDDHLQPS